MVKNLLENQNLRNAAKSTVATAIDNHCNGESTSHWNPLQK
jgi:hypothetical protein